MYNPVVQVKLLNCTKNRNPVMHVLGNNVFVYAACAVHLIIFSTGGLMTACLV